MESRFFDILEKIDKEILIKCFYKLREYNLKKVIRCKISGLFYIPELINSAKIYAKLDRSHYFKAGTSEGAREVIQYGKPFI